MLDDGDASYTNKAYNLNDHRKVALREKRHETISNSILWIKQWLEHIQELTYWAQKYPDDRSALLSRATQVREAIYETFLKLKNYAPIPSDAPSKCQCETTAMHCLPEEFSRQVIHVEDH